MNVFTQFYKSIYSPKTIASFRFQGIGKTILYVFLISLLSILPVLFFLGSTIVTGLSSFDETVKKDFPDFKIVNGTLQSDAKEPIEKKIGNYIIVFDSSGKYGAKEMEQKENAVGLLKNQFIMVSGGQSQSYTYNMTGNTDLTKAEIVDLLNQFNSMKPILLAVLAFIVYFFSSASKFIEITVLALIGLLLKNLAGKKTNYKQLWVIAAYSVTLGTLFFTIMGALQANVPSAGLLNWFIHIVILYLAIKEIPGSTSNKKLA